MIKIMYECRGSGEEYLFTTSLPEAKSFIEQHGGTYKRVEETTMCKDEPHSIKNHRTF